MRLNAVNNILKALKAQFPQAFRMHRPLTLMMDANAFYIEIYRKTKTQSLGVNGLNEYYKNKF